MSENKDNKNPPITPVILCGGSGTRLWPLSRRSHPKQLLRLTGEFSLLQETLLRLKHVNTTAPTIVCNEEHRFIVAEQLREIDIQNALIILEPIGKNTAPAAALAALELIPHSNDAMMLVLPADHMIKNNNAFETAIQHALTLAISKKLVTFGIKPVRAETGYGYIKIGSAISDDAYVVEAFIEKPNRETAASYLQSGHYLWNSGMFLFHAKTYLAELSRFAPDILASCTHALSNRKLDSCFLRVDTAYFHSCKSDSIDYAVMEKSDQVAVVSLDAGWSDIGAWDALWEIKNSDVNGNITQGDVCTTQVKNSYLHAESRLLTAVGVENLIIVETADAVLVADKKQCQHVKELVNTLQAQSRPEVDTHRRVYRPWGYYEILETASHFQVKRLSITPGAQLSLQKHQHRSEHWIVLEGTASIVLDEKQFTLHANQSTYIPVGSLHRLANNNETPLTLIEVQTGSYLGEDDIVRYEDTYGRELNLH